ncbi:hypothetical protein AKJ62_01115 [candidate division MSBL1 archaeon SCGC-AAA259D14]|uniref:Uncharacterized protein n=1 Tax=candidate division MSBL1 archaeon SCGC-AAA259D14 TaxID=1698261 RepID=A0A133U836_9EURY|nr:hypothetical protein AKJ62_01115 [candidate division MSBL1 archaeon SCGC-AAA259D14]
MGTGRGMRSQQPSQGPGQQTSRRQTSERGRQQPSRKSSQAPEDVRIDQLEKRMENLENQLKKIGDALEDLKEGERNETG